LACNAVLGIEEPLEKSNNGAGGSASNVNPGTGTGSAGSSSMPATPGKDAGNPPTVSNEALEWAQWPMPNPTTAGLPNAQSYDTASLAGVVIDLITGLQWQQAIDEKSYSWMDASAYCGNLTLSGGGWRLPKRIELVSLVDYTNPNPVIDPNSFPQTPAEHFWTSSSYAGDTMNAWTVNFQFSDGITEKADTSKAFRVRCVR
jgi:hypothetical protein